MRNNKLGRLYRDGEIVINKGDEGTCLFVIQEGKVEVFDENGGSEVKIAELGQVNFLVKWVCLKRMYGPVRSALWAMQKF